MTMIEKRGSFDVLTREVRHDRFGMQLIADTVVRPDGTQGQQYWIAFPREAVMVFPVDSDGNVYLSREFTYAANDYKIEAAGGTADEGESLEAAAIRELKEELGVDASELRKIGVFQDITSRVDNRTHVYLAKFGNVGKSAPESGEDVGLLKMSLRDAVDLVRKGTINTSVVAASIWFINDLLSTGGQTDW